MFYHLTASPMEDTAAQLLARAVGAGWRVMLRGTDAARLDWLDQRFWVDPVDSFLPHGREGGEMDDMQPVLLGLGAVPDGAKGLMAVDGARVSIAEAEPLERVWILFDGNDDAAVTSAREQWKSLAGAGLAAQYWSEESGRWEKKAG